MDALELYEKFGIVGLAAVSGFLYSIGKLALFLEEALRVLRRKPPAANLQVSGTSAPTAPVERPRLDVVQPIVYSILLAICGFVALQITTKKTQDLTQASHVAVGVWRLPQTDCGQSALTILTDQPRGKVVLQYPSGLRGLYAVQNADETHLQIGSDTVSESMLLVRRSPTELTIGSYDKAMSFQQDTYTRCS